MIHRPPLCLLSLLLASLTSFLSVRGRAQTVTPGSHAVGFRVLETVDYSRSTGPKRDYTGAAHPENDVLPLPISVWYPARPGTGEPMAYGTYLALAQAHKRDSFGPITDDDRQAATNLPQGVAQFAFGGPLTDAELAAIMEQPAAARRDAEPEAGTFPLIVAGLYGSQSANKLAEHLASYGYVVATGPMRPEVSRQEVTMPHRAIETQSRNMEYVRAQMHDLPFVDTGRMGLLGLNFEGFAALIVQMRTMQADAVVSLDGWHDKRNGSETLQEALYFDALKMRVPYLSMVQANPPRETLAPDPTVFDALRYADRTFYVVRDFEHHHFVGDLLAWTHLREQVEPAYAFVYATVRRFFDAHVKHDAEALAWLQQSPSEKGFAPDLIEQTRHASALAPVPTRERFAELLEHDLPEAVRVFRAARAANPKVDLVTLRTLNLMVFRARHRDAQDDVITLNRLKTEAFPTSAQAFYDLGRAYQQAERRDEAAQAFRQALERLSDDPSLSEAECEALRRQITDALDEVTDS